MEWKLVKTTDLADEINELTQSMLLREMKSLNNKKIKFEQERDREAHFSPEWWRKDSIVSGINSEIHGFKAAVSKFCYTFEQEKSHLDSGPDDLG